MNEVLDRQIVAYEACRDEMERDHLGEWVVFHDEQCAGIYPTFEDAAEDANRTVRRRSVPHLAGWRHRYRQPAGSPPVHPSLGWRSQSSGSRANASGFLLKCVGGENSSGLL